MDGKEVQMFNLGPVPIGQELQHETRAEEGKSRSLKKPRRTLHFSDGTLEEYSTDEEAEESKPDSAQLVDPKTLRWAPWVYHWMMYSSNGLLSACDYVGESLANFLGITSPKYQYEIDEYQRTVEEEENRKKEEEAEMSGWTTTQDFSTNTASLDNVSVPPVAATPSTPHAHTPPAHTTPAHTPPAHTTSNDNIGGGQEADNSEKSD